MCGKGIGDPSCKISGGEMRWSLGDSALYSEKAISLSWKETRLKEGAWTSTEKGMRSLAIGDWIPKAGRGKVRGHKGAPWDLMKHTLSNYLFVRRGTCVGERETLKT